MKITMKIIGLFCLAMILFVGIYLFTAPKTLDFRGIVTEIETMDHETVFHVSDSSIGTSYLVVADRGTDISPCHKEDPEIDLADIKIGDIIEGDYRWLSKNNKAKFITVWYHNE